MNKKLIRKMQTAAGGPLRIKFTPEQIALFENQATRVPGMNNSGGNRYREEGVLALQYLEQEEKRKEEEIKSRMEMRPTLKRKATIVEKLQGKKDEYKQTPLVVGMSGTDPVGEFILAGIGLNGVGALAKTGLWNVAKYAPTTQLGNWGRSYFVGNAFKNSFIGNVPTLTTPLTSLLYLPAKQLETGLTSLKFFERPSLSSAEELAGATKWERNFRPKWHIANYPGYLLKGLMKGSLLEKQLSKNGTININLLNSYFNKASQLEREVANKVLAERFAGQKAIDYNLFKKAVLDELINYSTKPQMQYSTYGMDRLGFNVIKEPDGNGGIIEYLPGIKTNTFTFESPRISVGNNKHYDPTTLGHSRTYTTPDEPNILHVMESLSDWGQSHVKMMPSVWAHQIAVEKALKSGNTNAFHSFTDRLGSLLRDKLTKYERMALENINKEIESGQPSGFSTIDELYNKKYEILKKAGNRSNIGVLGLHLHDNYLLRQLQENLKYASEHGQTKMRYPTSETAAKIEGYAKQNVYKNPEGKIVTSREALQHSDPNIISDLREDLAELASNLREQGIQPSTNQLWIRMNAKLKELESPKLKEGFLDMGLNYPLEHQTILKKYADFPKLFLKLFKDLKVRTVTDAKENTWYEVDVPKGYLSREWQFKQGGKMNILEFLKNGGQVRKMQTAAGGPIKRLKDGYRYIPDEHGGWARISDNSMADVFATMEFTPKKTKTGSSITRKQSAPFKTYYSAYNPDDVIKGFNTLTLGGLNNLSPTLWARRAYDTGKLLTGNMTWSGYTNSWINGNNGVVSLNFKEEHPVLSNSINGGLDLATFSLPKVSLYPAHFVLLVATPITGSYIGAKLGEEVDNYLPKKIQGYGGMLGYMLGGGAGMGVIYKNNSNIPLIHTKYKKLNDVINYPITTTAATIKGKYPWTKKQDIRLKRQLFDDIEEARNFLLKSGYPLENLPAIRIAKKPQYREDELGHYSPYYNTVTVKPTINPYSNLPIESLESVGSGFKGVVNHELTHGRLQYFGALSEFDPKAGYYVPRKDIKTPILDPFRKKKVGSWEASPDEFDSELSNLLISTGKLPTEPVDNILPLQIRFGIWDKNKAREVEDLLLLLRKNQEFFKDGGKMNTIKQFKQGSGIHIKKKNRGSFTRWCGGNVTEECIRRGKASSNPKIRKKATFADNARHFKHRFGGLVIKAEEGTKTNFFNNPKFLLGLLIGINSLALLLGTYLNVSKNINTKRLIPKTYLNISTKDININELIPGIHYSEISLAPIIQEELYKLILKEMKKLEDYVLNLLLELNISDKATLGTSFLNQIPEFINTGFHFYNTLKNYKLSSGINETSKLLTKKINFWDNPTITNSIDLNFWTNPTILNSKKNENNPYF